MATAMVTATRTDFEHCEAGRDSFGVPASPFLSGSRESLSLAARFVGFP